MYPKLLISFSTTRRTPMAAISGENKKTKPTVLRSAKDRKDVLRAEVREQLPGPVKESTNDARHTTERQVAGIETRRAEDSRDDQPVIDHGPHNRTHDD